MNSVIEAPDQPETDDIPLEVWQEYSRRKAEIENIGLDSTEHARRCQEIADELGI